jgi:hypothetical protein
LVLVGPALTLSGEAMGARLAELGLRPNSIMEGEKIKLTVVSPRNSLGTLGLVDVGTTSAADANGWASVRGSVISRFNAEAGSRYLVDFSVGDLPAMSTSGTRHFTARIYNGENPAPQVQQFTVPKGPQHVVMIVEAKGTRPAVSLTLTKEPGAVGAMMGTLSTGSPPPAPQFSFYWVEISKLK